MYFNKYTYMQTYNTHIQYTHTCTYIHVYMYYTNCICSGSYTCTLINTHICRHTIHTYNTHIHVHTYMYTCSILHVTVFVQDHIHVL